MRLRRHNSTYDIVIYLRHNKSVYDATSFLSQGSIVNFLLSYFHFTVCTQVDTYYLIFFQRKEIFIKVSVKTSFTSKSDRPNMNVFESL